MRRFVRLFVGIAAICAALAVALRIWLPPAGSAQEANQAPGYNAQFDPGTKGRLPAIAPVEPPTGEVLVFLKTGTNAARFASEYGLAVTYRLKSDPNAYVMAAPDLLTAEIVEPAIGADTRVKRAYPNRRNTRVRHGFDPNDPYFHFNTPSPPWSGQWHLKNELNGGPDARVMGAWSRSDTPGNNVVIGIEDDCVETAHPDLAPNYDAANSWDFGQNNADPNPASSGDQHGISVAGVAAARGGNAIGITGAAPFAKIAGLRQDFNAGTDAQFVDGLLYHSSGANTDIKIKNHSYGYAATYVPDPQYDALAISAGAGTIHCVSAGNYRQNPAQDCNKLAIQASPNAVTVAALGSNELYSYYSSFGASVFVTAPSSDYTWGITTTDRTTDGFGYNGQWDDFPNPDYTTQFGGTSSSCPLVAGVMALVKQVQPNLNTRFAKHLMARTSDIVNANDSTVTGDGDGATAGSAWRTNAAGFTFNQNYGFGLIDADQLTLEAVKYQGVTPAAAENVGTTNVNTAIPDNDPVGISRNFTLSSTVPVEELLITLNVTHPFRGDLEVFVTSPSGSTRRLVSMANDSGANIDWTFCTNAFWGENPAGQWTLVVADKAAADLGTWNSYSVSARVGTLLPKLISLDPSSKAAGSAAFILTVNGSGFRNDGSVRFNGQIRNTTFVNSTQLTAEIPATDVASAGNFPVDVLHPDTGGVPSNALNFAVTGGGPTYSLVASPTPVDPGDIITVNFTAPAGSAVKDWIGMYRVGAPNNLYGQWRFTNGATSGAFNFTAPSQAGDWEFRYLINNSFVHVATSNTVTIIAPPHTLTASPSTASFGYPLQVNWTAPAGSSTLDWVGLFRVGDPDNAYVSWFSTGGATSGNKTVTTPSFVGNIEFRYFLNNGFTKVVTSNTVAVTNSYTLHMSPDALAPGAPLTVDWTAPAGSSNRDWVAIYRTGTTNDTFYAWAYTNGATSGSINFPAPSPNGTYEARYLLNNTYEDVQRSNIVYVNKPGYSLVASPSTVIPGAQITVNWVAPAGSSNRDWIALYRVGVASESFVGWAYTNGATSGSMNLTIPMTFGVYECRYLLNNGYTEAARSNKITAQ